MATRERVDSPLRPAAAAVGDGSDLTQGDAGSPQGASGEPAARLALRELTGWEEEYLERHQSDPNTARLCNEVLARCLVAPGADPTEARETVRALLVAERDRELIALRTLSLGAEIRAHVDCPACGQVSEVTFSLDALPLGFQVPERRITTELPAVGPVRLHLPTAGDQEDLEETGLVEESERRTWLLARCLERYGERTDGLDTDFTRGLPMKVRRWLEAAIGEKLPELDLEMAVECSHCATPFSAPFDVRLFFFRISRARRRSASRRAPARSCLPLGGTGHRRPAAAAAARLPAAARGGARRRPACSSARPALTPTHGRGG